MGQALVPVLRRQRPNNASAPLELELQAARCESLRVISAESQTQVLQKRSKLLSHLSSSASTPQKCVVNGLNKQLGKH